MPRKVNIAEAKAKLSELAEAASRGEEIILARNGKPFARLAPLEPVSRAPRKFGQQRARAKSIDWDRWWSDWKAMDLAAAADFDASSLFPGGGPPARKPSKAGRR